MSRARRSGSRCRGRATTPGAWPRSASTSPPTAIAAYAFAALIAAVAGVLLVWHGGQISPGTAGIGPVIDILIIAVAGGLTRPIGPFIGALIFVILRTFALDALEAVGLDGKRFQLLIGIGFLLIVLFSPDGVLGLWARWRERLTRPNGDLGARDRGAS